MDTVTLTIDGRQVTVERGKTVLQAAIEHGVPVPYYCYHPGLGIDGSCRVCIVKIERMPKLQTACSTACAEGMIVHTQSADVVAARAGVFELLLLNHPLDCPVCDKGGECPLQDFSYTFGPEQSRMEFARRVFDGEGVKGDVDFGPTLMLNRQRCILCTRCVRFMREVEGDAQIGIVDRGYGSAIATFEEQGVHSLLSGNLMDVCPVGAITTRDYRFKSRPWDNPRAADTICTLCSKGCNTTAWIKAKPEWAKGAQLVRFTPRFNPDVNGYWMCDIGRLEYHWIEGEHRLRRPLGRSQGGSQQPLSWSALTDALRERLGAAAATPDGVRFLLSAHGSLEELFLFQRLADGLPGPAATRTAVSWRHEPKRQPPQARFGIPAVDAPNVNGARLLGLAPGAAGDPQGLPDVSALRSAVEAGQVAALFVFDPGPEGSIGDTSWAIEARASGRLPLLIVQGVLLTRLAQAADFVLPGASFVEKEASYTNDRGRLQATARVMAPPGEALEDWQIVVNLGGALGVPLGHASLDAVRAEIADRFAGVGELQGLTGLSTGHVVKGQHWLQGSNPSERWKWDAMFQDVPPTKFAGEPFSTNFAGVIPLKEIK
jgi:NADH-quinone oxidoreductase subunit G